MTARTSYSWRTALYTDLVNTTQLRVPSHGVWDASLTWEATEYSKSQAFGMRIPAFLRKPLLSTLDKHTQDQQYTPFFTAD
jgi:hypothetical protein